MKQEYPFREWAELQAERAYALYKGQIVLASVVNGWRGDDSVEQAFEPPIRVRIVEAARNDDIVRYCGEWIDPCWPVEILDTDRSELTDADYADDETGGRLRSTWVYGFSYNAQSGQVDPATDWKPLPEDAVPPALPPAPPRRPVWWGKV